MVLVCIVTIIESVNAAVPCRAYRAVMVAGTNVNGTLAPSGPVATPLTESVEPPGAIASNSTAASRPVPDAPVASPRRVIVMSTRPLPGSALCETAR